MAGRAWLPAVAAGVAGAAAATVGGRFPGHAPAVAAAGSAVCLVAVLVAGRFRRAAGAPLDGELRRLYALHEVTCAAASIDAGKSGLESALETIRATLDARVAAFLLPAGGGSRATCVAAVAARTGWRSLAGRAAEAPPSPLPEEPAPQSAGALWHAVEGGRAEVVAGVEGWLPEVIRTGAMDVALLAGAMAGGRTCGALVVGFSAARRLSEPDREFACHAAHVLGVAAANMRQYHEAGAAARAADRRRIAADLHDGPAQTLVLLKLKAEAALAHGGGQRAAAMAEALRSIAAGAQNGLDEVRDCIRVLRPEPRPPADLLPALAAACNRWSELTGIDVDLDADGAMPLPADAAGEVLHIVREALANVGKHAHARHVALRVQRDGSDFEVAIADDGLGFDPALRRSGHYGLGILRERAAAIGGRLEIHSREGAGTEVVLRLPSPQAALAAHG